MKLSMKAGSTSQTIDIFISDSTSTTGAGLPGLVYNSAGLTAYFVTPRAVPTAITLATLAANNSVWATGGFKEVDATNMPGVYRLDLPNAAIASGLGNSSLIMLKGATNMAPLLIEIALEAWDNQDAVRGGLTALPNANAEAAGGLFTRGTGAGQINQVANGMIDANVVRNAGTAITAASGRQEVNVSHFGGTAGTFAAGRPEVNTTHFAGSAITAAAGIPEVKIASIATGAITAAAIAADAITDAKVASDVTIASVTGAVGSVTGAVGSVTGNVGGNVVGSVGSVATGGITAGSFAADAITAAKVAADVGTEIATAVWAATTRLLTAGTNIVLAKGTGVTGFNDLSAAQVNTECDTALSDAGVTTTVTGRIDAAISTRASSSALTSVASDITSILGYVDTEVAAIKTVTDKVNTMLEGAGPYQFTAAALTNADAAVYSAMTNNNLDGVGSNVLATYDVIAKLDSMLEEPSTDNFRWSDFALMGMPDNITALNTAAGIIEDMAEEHPTLSGYRYKAQALDAAPTGGLDAAGIRTAIGLASANLDTQLADIPTVSEFNARTLTSASYATASKQVDIETDTQDIQSRLPTALVSGRMDVSVGAMAADVITAAAVAADVGTEIATAVWALTTRTLSAGTNIVLAKGTGITGFNDLSAAQVNAEVDTAIADVGLTTTITGRIDATVSSRAAASVLGAAVGASISADIAAVKAQTAAIEADTQDIQNRIPAALVSGRIDASVGAMAANVMTAAAAAADLTTELQSGLATAANLATVAGYLDTEIGTIMTGVSDIKAKTDALPSDPADQSLLIAAIAAIPAAPTAVAVADEVQTRTIAAVTTVNGIAANAVNASALASDAVAEIQSGLATSSALSTVAGYIDTEVAAIKAKTDNLPATPAAAGDIHSLAAIADAVLDEAVEGAVTLRQSIRLANAANGAKAIGMDTTTGKLRDLADTKDRVTATLDGVGNRTAVSLDLT